MRRARLLGLTIAPAVVLDDGEHLIPVDTKPLSVPAHRLDELPALLREALAELQARLDVEAEQQGAQA